MSKEKIYRLDLTIPIQIDLKIPSQTIGTIREISDQTSKKDNPAHSEKDEHDLLKKKLVETFETIKGPPLKQHKKNDKAKCLWVDDKGKVKLCVLTSREHNT